MAQEIGVAYVSLLPSGKGFSKATQNEAEKGFKGAEKSSNSFFSGLTKWAKRGAVVVGGMVTAIGGLAIGGGISRALNIEDATAKLKGLGHDTKTVEAIMNDALASVKGTAFGLDAAATTAASAVAAGIKPGQELTKYLTLTADAATIAGTSMEEMGSIINQVTSKGYAGMENLNRLTERGIPIMQWLQEEYGVTADELTKMVSRGEIDAETFRRAIENNIGGAALASGETTRGAFANMRAALSRLGLAFVGDGLSGAKTFFNEVTKILDGLTERVGPWVKKIQDKLKGAFNIDGMGDRFLEGLDRFVSNFDSTPLGLLLEALKPLVPLLREVAEEVGPLLAETLGEVWRTIEPMIPLIGEELVDAIVELTPPLTDLLVALLPLIPPLVELALLLLPALIWAIEQAVPGVVSFIEGLTVVATAYADAMKVISGDKTLDEFGYDLLASEGALGDWLRSLADTFIGASVALTQLRMKWDVAWFLIGFKVQSIVENIKAWARGLWEQLPADFRDGVNNVLAHIKVLEINLKVRFISAGSWLISSGKALINGFISGIRAKIREVAAAVAEVMSVARGFFPNSPAKWGPFSGSGWTALQQSGSEILDQFMSGMDRDMPLVQARLNSSLSIPRRLVGSAPSLSMPSELVVRDVDGGLVGRMRVEAQGVAGALFSPSSAVATRSQFGNR